MKNRLTKEKKMTDPTKKVDKAPRKDKAILASFQIK